MTGAAPQLFAAAGGSSVGNALFWFSRLALAVAGAAFLLYVLVIAGLCLITQVTRSHRRPPARHRGGRR